MRKVVVLLGVAIASCEKPPLAESVYTGARPIELDAASPVVDPDRVGIPQGGAEEEAARTLPQCAQEPASDHAFDKRALIASIARCTRVRYCEFQSVHKEFVDTSTAYAADPSLEKREQARAAWRRANLRWQRAEFFSFGPAARPGDRGGRGLRDAIYVWPALDRCLVEEQTVSQIYLQPSFERSYVIGKSLAAAEYLLYAEHTTDACRVDGWGAVSPETFPSRRAAYTAAVAADVQRRADELVVAWAPGSPFSLEFEQPASGRLFMDAQQVLEAVGYSLFYLDTELKDLKLGLPLGLTCLSESCVERVEAREAGASAENVRANLQSFRDLFEGCEPGHAGLGFDDWLRALGQDQLADRTLAAIASSERALSQLDRPIDALVRSDRAKVVAAHASIKAITDILKTELVSVLDLERPMSAEGDND